MPEMGCAGRSVLVWACLFLAPPGAHLVSGTAIPV
jgi:hypothetical protein